MSRTLRAGLVLSALVASGLAVPAQAAEVVYEVVYIDSVDDSRIRIEIQRNAGATDQPVILTYSPYNSLAETQPADDAVAARYLPQGYARAVADVIGTRGSDGCWDYGGAVEQQSGADVVRYLADREWSNGRVGMTGVSYEGTTANMVAALGEEIAADSNGGKGLAGIVPIAAISRWYGYAYSDGVRFLGNSRTPTDEGFDTPLAFDLGFGRTVAPDPTNPDAVAAATDRTGECSTAEHTERGYDRSPDYDDFWTERDYRKDAADFRVPTMVVHGWQDYNVKQLEATALFEALPVDDPATREVEGVPFKKLWMTQASHANGSGEGYQEQLDAFWEHTLKGVDNGIEQTPEVVTRGRTAAGPAAFVQEASWPPAGTAELTLHLGRSAGTGTLSPEPQDDGTATHVNPGTVTEEAVLRDPSGQGLDVAGRSAWLYQESEPLTEDLRIAGSAVLEAAVNSTTAGQHLTPILTEVRPDGTQMLVERGFLNLDYAGGLAKADPRTGDIAARVNLLPQDYTFTAGSRIGLFLMGSNTVWGVPGSPGALTYAMGPVKGVTDVGTRLVLPVVGDEPAAELRPGKASGKGKGKGKGHDER